MPEATIQNLTTALPGETPFFGDGAEGEITTNSSDGRIWVFNEEGLPVELGGSCSEKPIGFSLVSGNYLDLDITDPDNLPIPNTDPTSISPGFYKEKRILLRFSGEPLTTFSAYFDYPVEWGDNLQDPISQYSVTGASILIELSSFGPQPYWMGRLLWVKTP
jgi:hypothetical protein